MKTYREELQNIFIENPESMYVDKGIRDIDYIKWANFQQDIFSTHASYKLKRFY